MLRSGRGMMDPQVPIPPPSEPIRELIPRSAAPLA